ncbi:uncharacterized protein CEXT_380841 [Caerostris extrusa]|uniref:Gustatory receptor n=1 Tax=Caerostris extrusa TaxID=172846 RepID=A0AAV4TAZ0_CAEEX|nr:uncharacterized protein CEXT_380841 [Caerostris extrusa]
MQSTELSTSRNNFHLLGFCWEEIFLSPAEKLEANATIPIPYVLALQRFAINGEPVAPTRKGQSRVPIPHLQPSSALHHLANAVMILTSLIQRWALSFKMDKIKEISSGLTNLTEQLNLFPKENRMSIIYLCFFLTTLFHVPIAGCSISVIYKTSMKVMLFRCSASDSILVFLVLFTVTCQSFLMLTVNTFAVYYTTLCYQMKLLIKSFASSLTKVSDSEYNQVFKNYISIRKSVSNIDTELSFFVFSSTVYNACVIYFGLAALIHPDEYFDILQNVTIWCLFVASFVSYFSLALSGCFVYEAAEDLWLKAHEVLATKKNITSFQARFLSIVDKNYISVFGKQCRSKEVSF